MGDFFRSEIVAARKPHRCECCRSEIPKGSKYRRDSGCSDGEMFRVAVDLQCESLMRLLLANDDYGFYKDGIEYERVWEYAELDGLASRIAPPHNKQQPSAEGDL